MKPEKIRLFIKPYCGWCHQAMNWLRQRGIDHQILDVTADEAAREEMWRLSHQTLAPVIEVEGKVLADFGAKELEAWWKQQGFEVSH